MDASPLNLFFNALAGRFYKENDLSDVTWAMCEASPASVDPVLLRGGAGPGGGGAHRPGSPVRLPGEPGRFLPPDPRRGNLPHRGEDRRPEPAFRYIRQSL